MLDLRLIGVHEDGRHLLLADEHGSRFRVALDDALRAAARHQRPHPGHVSHDVETGHRPRDVQALIRAGLTAQEVAERCGWPVDKVHKYEVPILAEREYVAGLARLVRLRSRGSSGQQSPTLAGRVADRLQTRGVDSDEVSWDAHRPAGSEWTVVLTFPAGGRQRQASWGFDPSTHAIHPRDDEARWFSEDDTPGEPDVLVREVPVYDVEAEGGVGADPPAERGVAHDPLDLVTAMRQRTNARSRRGSRRRPSEGAALPLEPDPSHNGIEAAAEDVTSEGLAAGVDSPPLDQLDSPPAGDSAADSAGDSAAEVDTPPSPQAPPRAVRKPNRVPVPSWDEVILGARPSAD